MILTDDEIIKKYGKNCPSCDRKTMLPYKNEYTCYFCDHSNFKTKEQLSNFSKKKQNFSLSLNYGKKKILTICVDIAQIYFGDDYNTMYEVLSGLKYRKLNVKSELFKYYKLMTENFYEDQCSKQAKYIYKVGYKAIALMVFLYQCQYYNNVNYHDLLGSVLYVLKRKIVNLPRRIVFKTFIFVYFFSLFS